MPATFPSHAAAVLPLKLWRPRWFDGVALVIGSASPDLAYPLLPYVQFPETHTWAALLWFALPVTLALSWLVRLTAPTIAVHLPAYPALLGLRDYGVLGTSRPRWRVTVGSALLGAATHIFWDGFTHRPDDGGWFARIFPVMQEEAFLDRSWFKIAQHGSTLLGGLIAVLLLLHIGRRRLLVAWHGEPPATPSRPAVFWPVTVTVALVAMIVIARDPYNANIQGVRVLEALGAALLAGALAVLPAPPDAAPETQ